MIKNVTIIRHAQSLFNQGERNCDLITNCPLSDSGKYQCQNLNGKYDLIILSPLKRAIETYTYSNIKTKNIIISHLFREQVNNSDDILNGLHDEILNEESNIALWIRARQAIEFIKLQPEENMCIISHGMFICYFLDALNTQHGLIGNLESFNVKIMCEV
jgi:broad specificity phosphatase PhoE